MSGARKTAVEEPSGRARAGLALVVLALFVASAASPTGLIPAIDEACFVQWAVADGRIADWKLFLAPKPIPATLANLLISAGDSGLLHFYGVKGVFALFAAAAVAGVFAWRRASGDSAHDALLTAGVFAATPWLLNGAGRLLSEIPALAFAVWGMWATEKSIARSEARDGRVLAAGAWIAMAMAFFMLAVCSRSTAFATVGAFLGFRVLWGWLDASEPASLFERARRPGAANPCVIALLYALILFAWPFVFEYPAMPWGLVRSSVTAFSRPPQATVAAFFFGGGVWLFAAGCLMSAALPLGAVRRVDAAVVAWLMAAASPYLAITLLRGEVLPRHAADFALPLAYACVHFAGRLAESTPTKSPARWTLCVLLLAAMGAAWRMGHVVASRWSAWFTHGALDGRSFFLWTLAGLVAVAGLTWTRQRRRALYLIPFILLTGLAHVYLALSGISTDNCSISPVAMRWAFLKAGIDQDAGEIVLPLAHYECAIMQFALPDWPLVTLDFHDNLKPVAGPAGTNIRWAAIPYAYIVDDPAILRKTLRLAGKNLSLVEVDRVGQVILFAARK